MHLKKIILQDFQSYKYEEMEFSPSLNVIVGANNVGKTSILRAIRFVVYNEPDSRYFIRTGAKYCSVTTEWSNNYTVIREKGTTVAGRNRYIIRDPDGNEEVYSSFGKSVPEDVSRILQMAKVEIGGSLYELQYGGPLEGPFLISASPAEKALFIGQLADSVRIDKVLDKLASDIRRDKTTITSLQSSIKEKSSIIDGDNTAILKKRLSTVYKALTSAQSEQDRLEKLKLLRTRLSTNIDSMSSNNEYLSSIQSVVTIDVQSVVHSYQTYALLRKNNIDLTNLESQLHRANILASQILPDISSLDQDVSKYSSFKVLHKRYLANKQELHSIPEINPPQIDDVLSDYNLYVNVISLKQKMDTVISEIRKSKIQLTKLENRINSLTDELRESLKGIEVCPICNRPIKEEEFIEAIISDGHTH